MRWLWMDCMSNDTAVEFQPLVFAVDGNGGISRSIDGDGVFFFMAASEGGSPDANEIFLDLGFLRGDNGK